MDEPLDERFFKWLCRQVADVNERNPAYTHWKLFKQLYSTECVWIVINDGNRLEDGQDLRIRFRQEMGINFVDPEWAGMPCSFLELMVGLSEMLSFEADGEPRYWFWRLMGNIGLSGHNDDSPWDPREVEEVTERVIFRQYQSDGTGGFFPLSRPRTDQRDVELWFQMSDYIQELF